MLSSGESTINYTHFIFFSLERRKINVQGGCSNMLIGPVVSELRSVQKAQFKDFLSCVFLVDGFLILGIIKSLFTKIYKELIR